ncbi:hypothetical protein Q7P37_002643 [Cladosporium fusiforme]
MKVKFLVMALSALTLARPTDNMQDDTPGPARESENAENLCSRAKWEELMFNTPLPTFSQIRTSQTPPCFNWTSDGCTRSPDKPSGFDFLPACHRHDFADNYLKECRQWTQENKDRVDEVFRRDMYGVCEGEAGFARARCRGLADFYRGVTGWWNVAEDAE